MPFRKPSSDKIVGYSPGVPGCSPCTSSTPADTKCEQTRVYYPFTVLRDGLVTGPTQEQIDAGYILFADGTWGLETGAGVRDSYARSMAVSVALTESSDISSAFSSALSQSTLISTADSKGASAGAAAGGAGLDSVARSGVASVASLEASDFSSAASSNLSQSVLISTADSKADSAAGNSTDSAARSMATSVATQEASDASASLSRDVSQSTLISTADSKAGSASAGATDSIARSGVASAALTESSDNSSSLSRNVSQSTLISVADSKGVSAAGNSIDSIARSGVASAALADSTSTSSASSRDVSQSTLISTADSKATSGGTDSTARSMATSAASTDSVSSSSGSSRDVSQSILISSAQSTASAGAPDSVARSGVVSVASLEASDFSSAASSDLSQSSLISTADSKAVSAASVGGGGTGANPTASVGLSPVNGVATTFMRSDAAPALSAAIAPTWTGVHTFTPQVVLTGGLSLPGGATITGASGAISFTAAGTNQGFNFYPSGVGKASYISTTTAITVLLNSASGFNSSFGFQINSVDQGSIGAVGSSGGYITGSIAGDIAFRSNVSRSFIFSVDSGVSKAFEIVASTGQVSVPKTIASTSTTTGALIVAGGVGIAGALNVAGTIYSGTASAVAPMPVMGVFGNSDAAGFFGRRASADGYSAGLRFSKSRGSMASPATVSSGDVLGTIYFGGHDGTNWTENMARIQCESTQAWTTGAHGNRIKMFVAANGTVSASVTPGILLDQDNSVTLGGALNVGGVSGLGIASSSTTQLNLAIGTTAISSLRIGHGAAPTTPVNGDVWTTTAGMYVRINGATVGPLGASTSAFTTQVSISTTTDINRGQLILTSTVSNNVGLSFITAGGATMRNWQIQTNYAAAGDLCIFQSVSNGASNPTTLVAQFSASGLAVTGAISATSSLTLSAAAGLITFSGATYGAIQSTSGDIYVNQGSGKTLYLGNANEVTIASAVLSVAGEIRATGNVIAYYSDDRLKTRLGNITNALDRVCTLTGFFYEANATAQGLGYKPVREVGLSAQDVEAVLPEVVGPAPIDPKYLTLDYARVVPLLVEAIKELNVRFETYKRAHP